MWLEVFCYNFYLLSIIYYLLSIISYLLSLNSTDYLSQYP